ncbi:MAG: hypothetical protein CMI09_07695 [Oceanospirillaceae bacterium]|nr:hypothetical protein [Oceanospirillaceae bacterium]|tara:strand:- start:40 stop:567 length:528 start_codon:yes stop_codon:yes gene_type:complete
MTTDHEHDDFSPEEPEYELVSKSEMKREMERLYQLGERLSELSPEQWNKFDLSDGLYAALEESKRIKQHGARKRHLHYIGKLMRDEDEQAIRLQLDLLDPSSEAYGRQQRQYEMWRSQLMEDDQAMQKFIDRYPTVDRQQLRNLVRNARKSTGDNPLATPGAKKLFQFIKDVTKQ